MAFSLPWSKLYAQSSVAWSINEVRLKARLVAREEIIIHKIAKDLIVNNSFEGFATTGIIEMGRLISQRDPLV